MDAMFTIAPQDFAFYADESGISKDRFTVVGGLCMHKRTANQVYASMAKYREDNNMRSELKWSKVSNGKTQEYQRLVDLFFALNNTNHIQFHCVIFDNHSWNHGKYNGGDPDVGLSKLYYDLLLHKFVKRCGTDNRSLYACLDHRNSSTSLEDLRRMLNATASRDYNLTHAPLAQLVSKDSRQDDILQMNDLILGAVCAVRNGRHLLAEGREAKRVIAEQVLAKSGLSCFDTDSPRNIHRFTVWNKVPRKR
jgi:hypothetical protein